MGAHQKHQQEWQTKDRRVKTNNHAPAKQNISGNNLYKF